jgi:hypothetical protein
MKSGAYSIQERYTGGIDGLRTLREALVNAEINVYAVIATVPHWELQLSQLAGVFTKPIPNGPAHNSWDTTRSAGGSSGVGSCRGDWHCPHCSRERWRWLRPDLLSEKSLTHFAHFSL